MSSFDTWLSTRAYRTSDDDDVPPHWRMFYVYSCEPKLELAVAEEKDMAERDKLIETLMKLPEAPLPKNDDDDSRLCVVCMDRNKTHVFTSCGHACVCEACSSNIDTCPLCRTKGKCIKLFI